jgi:hypothetical protein
MKNVFAEYPLRHFMKLVELGARFMDFVDLRCLAGKKWSGAVFLNLELFGALPNTPLMLRKREKWPRRVLLQLRRVLLLLCRVLLLLRRVLQ